MVVKPEIISGELQIKPPNSPRPNHAEMPPHLIKATGTLGTERAHFVEKRVEKIIAGQTNIVEKVVRNEQYGIEDTNGHDLTLALINSPVKIVHIQVKSSRDGVVKYKQKIRDSLPVEQRDDPDNVKWWLADNGIILLNGGETKTDADILESFYPQLERIQQTVLIRHSIEPSGQIRLFPEADQIQIFP